MNKLLVYLPLEPYEERYTLQLKEWNVREFNRLKIPYKIIEGDKLREDQEIKTGQVLDAHGRSYYALTQTAKLVEWLHSNFALLDYTEVIVFSEDMFTPGYEALPYIREQLPYNERKNLKFYTRCLAQSIDPDDFTFPWRKWMRHFEQLCSNTLDGIFVASTEMAVHLEMCMVDQCPIYVVGLPFGREEVLERAGEIPKPWEKGSIRKIVYTSRLDKEKQPHFFFDLIERFYDYNRLDVEFIIATGSKTPRSNDPSVIERMNQMATAGKLKVFSNLKKNEYYNLLKQCTVQFNCARQDWVSNTLNESSTLMVPTLAPAFRSFPEALFNEYRLMYTPWSVEDAYNKLSNLINQVRSLTNEYYLYYEEIVSRTSIYQDKTIERTLNVMLDDQYRASNKYRSNK